MSPHTTGTTERSDRPGRRQHRAYDVAAAEPAPVVGVQLDEQTIPAALAADILREHKLTQDAFSTAVEHAIRCGDLLLQAKTQVGHGRWGAWLAEHFPASDRTARGYMRLAANRQHVADLPSVREALAELAAPQDDRVTRDVQPPAQSLPPGQSLLGSVQSLLPDIEGEAWEAFRRSVGRFGVLVPVIVDQDGRIIDGRQRVRAAFEAGVQCRRERRTFHSDFERAACCYSANVVRATYSDSSPAEAEGLAELERLAELQYRATETAR